MQVKNYDSIGLARWIGGAVLVTSMLVGATSAANSAVREVKIAHAYGVIVLPLMIMNHENLFEKQAKADGLGEVSLSQVQLGTGDALAAALLSGSVHIASVGVPVMVTLWDKTPESRKVKGIAAMAAMPAYLLTRNPDVKTIKDFTKNDKIALPGGVGSYQGIILQMAAAKAFGKGSHARLNSLTVGLSHPDAVAAMLSGVSEINSHFASPPFHYIELQDPKIHVVTTSDEVLSGPASLTVLIASSAFRNDNAELYGAFLKAYIQAIDFIEANPKRAAEIYLEMTKDSMPLESMVEMLKDPSFRFSATPLQTKKFADFMHEVGLISKRPRSWQDLFFPDVHTLPGS